MPLRITLLLITAALLSACWTANINAADPIPVLNTKGDVYKTEGENDPLIYDPTVGEKKAVLLYVDFPDLPHKIDTKERGRIVLGEGKFQALFKEQSYGKLDIEVEHVHGWRRMPKNRKEYDTGTTEAHRAFFVDVFALYPKVDLLQYDYIMVSARVGNTAFGERDELAIPYRGEKIRVALNIASGSPYTLAHEAAHCMGLPDLYTYGGVEGPRNPTGPWDIMSGRSSGFLGWHRHKLKWLDADRKAYLTKGTHKLELTPLSAKSGTSLVAVPVDDAKSPSKVFVIEVAQPLRVRGGELADPKGILIYSVDATLETGHNPVVVYPRGELNDAAFQAGQTFEHKDAPLTVKVLKRKANGAYIIEVRVK